MKNYDKYFFVLVDNENFITNEIVSNSNNID